MTFKKKQLIPIEIAKRGIPDVYKKNRINAVYKLRKNKVCSVSAAEGKTAQVRLALVCVIHSTDN